MDENGRDVSTFKGLIDEYIEAYAKPRKTSWHEDLRVLNKDVLPKWKYLKVVDINKTDVEKLLEKIIAYNSNVAANKTLTILQAMFDFAVTRDVVVVNPCIGVAEPVADLPQDRVLNENEINKIWFGLNNAKMSDVTKLALKLLLVTGQRNGEVAGAKWKEIDLTSNWWVISKERTKNKKKHRVYLTKMAIEILRDAKKLSENSNCVFPTSKEGHITPRSINAAIRNNSEVISKEIPKHKPPYGDFFKIGYFVPNDLRRSILPLLSEVDEQHIAKVQNHSVSTCKDLKVDDLIKKQTLEAWEQKLQTILFGWRKPKENSKENNIK
jgi:integrase